MTGPARHTVELIADEQVATACVAFLAARDDYTRIELGKVLNAYAEIRRTTDRETAAKAAAGHKFVPPPFKQNDPKR